MPSEMTPMRPWIKYHPCPQCDRPFVGELDECERFWCTHCGGYAYPCVSHYGPAPNWYGEESA